MVSRHFSERLLQRFGIYSDDMTEAKLLMAISKKQAKYIRTDKHGGIIFTTKALGPLMVIVVSKDGRFITCDLPSKVGKR